MLNAIFSIFVCYLYFLVTENIVDKNGISGGETQLSLLYRSLICYSCSLTATLAHKGSSPTKVLTVK